MRRALFPLLLSAIPTIAIACESAPPPRPPPPRPCPLVASTSAPPPAPTNPTPYATADLVCSVELPGKHVPTPGCIVALPIDDDRAARLAELPNHDRWELHLPQPTDEQMKSLARVPWVRALVLEDPKLTNLDALASLPSLESVSIERGSVGSFSSLGAHAALRSIEIIDVDTPVTTLEGVIPSELVGLHVDGLQKLSDISALATLPALKIVDLERLPALKDAAPLAKLTTLEDLHLVDVPIADVPVAAEWATSLKELHVEGDHDVKSFAFLSKLADLRVLHLNDTPLDSVAPLAKLAKLEVLEIEKTKVADIAPLGAVKSLRVLVVDASMAKAKRDALAKALPHVEIRNFEHQVGEHVVELSNGTCEFACPPGDCLCDPKPVPCPK